MAMSHLAWLYPKQRRLEEAKALQMQTLTLMQKVLPDNDGRVIFSMDRLAAIYMNLDQLSSAERLHNFVLRAYTMKHGRSHSHALTVTSHLSITYAKQDRWSEVEALQTEILEGKVALLGETHPSTLVAMQSLAKTRRERGREEALMALLQDCVEKSVQVLRIDDANLEQRRELFEEWSRGGGMKAEGITAGSEEGG
jgi:hypothetical protein